MRSDGSGSMIPRSRFRLMTSKASPSIEDPAYLAFSFDSKSPWSKRMNAICERLCRFIGEQLDPGRAAGPDKAEGLLMVAMNVKSEAEADFNAWYNEEHLPRLAAVPGCLSARRFRVRGGTQRYVCALSPERARGDGIAGVERSREHPLDPEDPPSHARSMASRDAALSRNPLSPLEHKADICLCSARSFASVPCRFCCSLSRQASAQSYPTKPIRAIVPSAPGGPTDVAARVVAEKLTQRWKQQVIVDNRTGANGIIGTETAARAALPDGTPAADGCAGFHGGQPSAHQSPLRPAQGLHSGRLLQEADLPRLSRILPCRRARYARSCSLPETPATS